MDARTTNSEISGLRAFLGGVTRFIKICCVITPLQLLVARSSCRQKMAAMRSLPVGTVGHDLAQLLDSKGLKLIPGFEKHDLDHLILGYDMTPEDELCMQAYVIGNGRRRIQCFLFSVQQCCCPVSGGHWSFTTDRVGKANPLRR
ncbi:MAG: hypothetical protein R3C49_27920 [Planctomycetaceae bacterium]